MTSPLLSPAELQDLLARTEDVVLLDATVHLAPAAHDGDHRAEPGLASFREAHLPGARHLDLLVDLADPAVPYHFALPDDATAARVLASAGVHDGATVVLYDSANGFWSARAWTSLRALGIRSRVLSGGLAAWRAAGGEVSSGDVAPSDGPAPTVRRDPSVWASCAQVAEISAGRAPGTLVCTLDPEHFRGQAATRYARRGRIPGSLSLPARTFLAADGTVATAVPPDALAPVHGTAPVVLYCGGGVSASFTALGLAAAGLPVPPIYDGSLEDWSAHPELPLVVDAL